MGIKDALKSFFKKSEFEPAPFSAIKYGDEGWLTVYEGFLLEEIELLEGEKKANLLAYYAEYLARLARHEDAEKIYLEAIELGSKEAKFSYAYFLDFHNLCEESQKIFYELIEEGYEVFHHYTTMGNQKLMEDKYEEALVLFEEGEKLGNKRSKANVLLALIGLKRKEEAEEKLKLLVQDDEVPRHSIWAVYDSMIYEFCESISFKLYEEMLYGYKNNPWTPEKENEYRRLVDESVRLYTEAIKFEFNESTESFYKGSIYRQKCADEDMKQVRVIAEQWQKYNIEPIFEGRELEIQIEWEESKNEQYLSRYEEYWKFQKEHLGNARYKNEYYR